MSAHETLDAEELARSNLRLWELVADSYSIADIAVYAYTHVAHEVGYELDRWPAVQAWLRRVAKRPGYVNDLLPYPSNAHAGVGRSIYD